MTLAQSIVVLGTLAIAWFCRTQAAKLESAAREARAERGGQS